MKKLKKFLLMAVVMPTIAFASESSNLAHAEVANDTTFTVNNQKIVISQEGEQTHVKVFKENGAEMLKVSETVFTDSQDVENISVISPFEPQSLNKHKRRVSSHYPTFFFGSSMLPSSIGSMGGNSEMHNRDSKSWEWGITLTSIYFRLTKTLSLSSALSIGQVHHHFKDNYVLTTQEGISSMELRAGDNGEGVKKSYISYNVVRLPIMIEWQKRIGWDDAFFAVGPSIEYRWCEHSRYFIGKSKHTETSDINLNPFGINLEARAGYGSIMLYGRMGITPLLKKSQAPECYPLTIGLGFRL